jgi:beta-lactamase regulating signal transducer with metallopeptidase domain
LSLGWLAGVLVSLVPLMMGLWQLALLHSRSHLINEPRWRGLLDAAKQKLAIRRRVQLRQSKEALVPLTWGALRPVLLVPAVPVQRPRSHRSS